MFCIILVSIIHDSLTSSHLVLKILFSILQMIMVIMEMIVMMVVMMVEVEILLV